MSEPAAAFAAPPGSDPSGAGTPLPVSAPLPPLLEVRDLAVRIPTSRGVVQAVDGVTFSIGAGEVVGLVGESGSGKSVTCRAVMGLMKSPPVEVTGSALLHPRHEAAGAPGARPGTPRELIGLDRRERRRLWGAELAMVFQDPMTSLNPVMRVGQQVMEAVAAHENLGREARGGAPSSCCSRSGSPRPSGACTTTRTSSPAG